MVGHGLGHEAYLMFFFTPLILTFPQGVGKKKILNRQN